jgi:hypothetical protein
MKREFEMTEAELESLLEAMKPVPYIVAGGMEPRSRQENANDAWQAMGERMGFDHMTVEPIVGKPSRFFRAEPKAVPAISD